MSIDEGGVEYNIEQAEPIPGIQTSRIAWGGMITGTASELLQGPTEHGGSDMSARDEAAQWLVELLNAGPCPAKYVEDEAKAAGVAWATVRRASSALGIKKSKGFGGQWYWSKPNQVAHVAHVAQLSEGEQVEQVEQVKPPPCTTTHKTHKEGQTLEQVDFDNRLSNQQAQGQWGEREVEAYQVKLTQLMAEGLLEAEAEKVAGQFVDAQHHLTNQT